MEENSEGRRALSGYATRKGVSIKRSIFVQHSKQMSMLVKTRCLPSVFPADSHTSVPAVHAVTLAYPSVP